MRKKAKDRRIDASKLNANDFKVTSHYYGKRFRRKIYDKARALLPFAKKQTLGRLKTRAERRALTKIQGIIPNHGERTHYFDRHIWKELWVKTGDSPPHLGGPLTKRIVHRYWVEKTADPKNEYILLPKELEYVPLDLALDRAINSIASSAGMRRRKKEKMLREIVQKLHSDGKISFEGETKIRSLQTTFRAEVCRVLGIKAGKEFTENFGKYLGEETGWARDYIERTIKHILVREWVR